MKKRARKITEKSTKRPLDGKCAHCGKKVKLHEATFSATGIWCSDYCAERYMYDKGLL